MKTGEPVKFDPNVIPKNFVVSYLIGETMSKIETIDLSEEDRCEVVMNQLADNTVPVGGNE